MNEKSKFSLTQYKDERIVALVKKTGHKTLAVWAIGCVMRVLPYFEEKNPEDHRPRTAIETLRTWITSGVFKIGCIPPVYLAGGHAGATGEIHSCQHARRRAPCAERASRQSMTGGGCEHVDMAVIRKASLDAHAAAREVGEDNAARSAARAAGQAVATAHVPAHSIGAAIYALQAIHRASNPSDAGANIAKERDWQLAHLRKLLERIKQH